MEISVGVPSKDPLERAQAELFETLAVAMSLPKYKNAIPGTMAVHLMVSDHASSFTVTWVDKFGNSNSETAIEEY